MLFVSIGIDKPDGAPLRAKLVGAHMAYLQRGSVVKLAGPFEDEAGGYTGSMLIIEAKDKAAAEAWIAEEPFTKAGLFAHTELRAWFAVIDTLPKL